MSAAAPLRLGFVGCGRLVEAGYVPALSGLDGVVVTALADPDPARRDRIASLVSGAPQHFAGSAELAASGAVDAAVVASPAAAHLADASALASARVACLVEKPPAPGLAGAEALASLSPAPWVGFNRRFSHGAKLAGVIPESGPLELELELRYRRVSWGAVGAADPVVLDLAPHLVDLALMLSGSPEAGVRAAQLSQERAEIELETGRGAALISCAADRPHRERVAARVRGRRVAVSSAGGPLALVTSRVPGREHPLVASLRAQLYAFAAAAVQGEDAGLLATAEDGLRTMRVIDAIREAAG